MACPELIKLLGLSRRQALASLTVVAALLLARLLPLLGIAIIPIAGIVTGGAMTATSLAGRRFNDELRARRREVEGALALGLFPAMRSVGPTDTACWDEAVCRTVRYGQRRSPI
ncbi:ABC transporter permease [Micromonospora sp. WMMD1274]|uniref:ABC transporter permease n=1 Tax=Micromonospora sp. WMMD1274 TaxID=3404116 RepID=UPI003B95D82E